VDLEKVPDESSTRAKPVIPVAAMGLVPTSPFTIVTPVLLTPDLLRIPNPQAPPMSTGAMVGAAGAMVGTTGDMVGTTGDMVGKTGAMVGKTGDMVGETGAMVGETGAIVGSRGAMVGSSGAMAGTTGQSSGPIMTVSRVTAVCANAAPFKQLPFSKTIAVAPSKLPCTRELGPNAVFPEIAQKMFSALAPPSKRISAPLPTSKVCSS